jgi:hypothetical protein
MSRQLLFIAISILFSCFAKAIDIPDDNPEGVVEMYTPTSYDQPYRERRPSWTWNLAIQYEAISPTAFTSDLDGATYDGIFGQPITNIQGLFGPKYNTKIGSLGLDFLYGRGDIQTTKTVTSSLSLNKTGAAITYTMDTLFPNPIIAPYIQYQVFSISYEERATGLGTVTGNIAVASAIVGGLLFQLNWIDADSARAGYVEEGIQNSYIDIFAASYASTKTDKSPEFQSTTLGAGFRVEF